MNCTRCGGTISESAAFCPQCGQPAGKESTGQKSEGGLQPNVAGLLCYLAGFITGIFFLVAEPYKRDRSVRFHAFQSIFLSVAWVALYLVWTILWTLFPGLWWTIWRLYSLVSLGFIVLVLFLMYKAYNNQQFKVPIIGEIAARQA